MPNGTLYSHDAVQAIRDECAQLVEGLLAHHDEELKQARAAGEAAAAAAHQEAAELRATLAGVEERGRSLRQALDRLAVRLGCPNADALISIEGDPPALQQARQEAALREVGTRTVEREEINRLRADLERGGAALARLSDHLGYACVEDLLQAKEEPPVIVRLREEVERLLEQATSPARDRRAEDQDPPRAIAVRFSDGQMAVEVADGRVLAVPLSWFPWLGRASEKDRRAVRIEAEGSRLQWTDLNEGVLTAHLFLRHGSGDGAGEPK